MSADPPVSDATRSASSKAFSLTLEQGTERPAMRVDEPAAVSAAIDQLGVPRPSPVLLVIGGAGKLAGADGEAAAAVIGDAVIPVAVERGAAVVDGGTDSGVMRLTGQSRSKLDAHIPLIGVAAIGTVSFRGNTGTRSDPAPLESEHTQFVLVPGTEWGAESPWLPRVAAAIAGGRPVVAVLINGGSVSADDVRRSLEAGFPVVVVRGTGRLADELAGDGAAARPELSVIRKSPRLHVTESARPEVVRGVLLELLR